MLIYVVVMWIFVFFFNDTATTEIYTLSLHDALPICLRQGRCHRRHRRRPDEPPRLLPHRGPEGGRCRPRDRKSTRLNSSHANISYAVFCLKKKKTSYHSQHAIQATRPSSCTTSSTSL